MGDLEDKKKPESAADSKQVAKSNAAKRVLERRKGRLSPLELVVEETEDGGSILTLKCENEGLEKLHLLDSVGLASAHAANMLIDQLVLLYSSDYEQLKSDRINRAFAMLAELKPDGADESMLCAQMVATQIAAMNCMKRALLENQTFEGRELNLKYGTKLLQAYTQQFAALDKKRRGGQQKVVVKHVHVNEGGQAIVGDVSTGGGG